MTSRPSIIACELSRKKRLGLALFSRDGWVITNIFFRLVSSLAQRAQPSENKLLRTCFAIFKELQSIIFFLQRIENKKTLNGSPILKKVFLSIHSSRIFNIVCNNIVCKVVLVTPFLRHRPLDPACPLRFQNLCFPSPLFCSNPF